jgi:hypothetical protein
MRAAARALLALLAGVALWASPGLAEESCTTSCRDQSRQCRERCVARSSTSEAQMSCRSDCLREDDACRCDCGERTYCESGNKGMRGCNVLVAENIVPRGLRLLLARK